MSKLKKLPTDIATFSKMIDGNYLYIDKTQHVYNLYASGSNYHFLSRPRRFGKSLLISTLSELFSGNKNLFEDLWIGKSDWEWKQHPVIRLDFSKINHANSDELKQNLMRALAKIGKASNVDVSQATTPGNMLEDLVEILAQKNKVAILIDEYDKPIIDHITNLEIAEKNRDVLKSFYDVIKGLDEHLRAIFVTGVSKFAKASIFSGINNLNDLSQKAEAAALLGYTQQELERNFEPYIQDMAETKKMTKQEILDELKTWYNGYRFSKADVRVYNPFSVLYYLKDKERFNYWFESGTPTFLMDLLNERKESLKDFTGSEVTMSQLGPFDLKSISLIPLLYQTGYLTIADSFQKGSTDMIRLSYPNAEVAESFSRCILVTLTHLSDGDVVSNIIAIRDALLDNNIAQVCQHMRILFAHVPYMLHIEQESFYHSMFLLVLNIMGLDAQAEVATDKGDIDLVVKTPHRIFLIEFKFHDTAQHGLDQIHRKKYYEKFLGKGLPITLAGIQFDYGKKDLVLRFVEQQKE